ASGNLTRVRKLAHPKTAPSKNSDTASGQFRFDGPADCQEPTPPPAVTVHCRLEPQAECGWGNSHSIAEAAAKRRHSRISSVWRSARNPTSVCRFILAIPTTCSKPERRKDRGHQLSRKIFIESKGLTQQASQWPTFHLLVIKRMRMKEPGK